MMYPGMFWDWTMILLIPGIILAAWAQSKVKGAFNKYSKEYSQRNLQAQDVAARILRGNSLFDVSINRISGNMTDNYNPTNKTLNLSETVYGSSSIAAIGVAAHEAGHAIQHGTQYGPLVLRSFMYPAVKIGSTLSWPMFLAGIIFSFEPLMKIGIIAFGITVVFTLITLPVEFDASRRAVAILQSDGYLSDYEMNGVKKVLNAAALTYVASAVNALLQLLRLIILSNRRR